jgi:cyanophycinase
LILAGDLRSDLSGSVTQRFVTLSGGVSTAKLVVLALGYAKSTDAQADAKAFAAALQSQVTNPMNPVQWFVVDSKNQAAVQSAIASATGVLVTSPDQSRVMNAFAGISTSLRNAWAGGKVVLADNAAAAALGQAMSTDPTPTSSSLEGDSSGDFLLSGVNIQPGLNWIPGVAVEPRMVMDRHWGRVYNHLFQNHALLGLGVDVNTAIEFTATGSKVWGKNTIVVFDGRYASYADEALSERYVLLDTYVEGDAITP